MISPPGRASRLLSAKFTDSFVLFALSVGVVAWQCSRVGVFWDISYVMNTAYRISLGDIPYKVFPIPHAPLTFLIQAGIIRFLGAHYYNSLVYIVLIEGLTTALTYLLITSILPRSLALLCTAPLIFLGGYAILPLPFYDPDCCFFIVLGIFCLHKAEARGFATRLSFLSGVLLAVPIFVKQNVGLAFFVVCHAALLFFAFKTFRRDQWTGYFKIVLGSACALVTALAVIHWTCGISNYLYWTFSFAKARRVNSLGHDFLFYSDLTLWFWVGLALASSRLLAKSETFYRRLAGILLWVIPFAWASFMTLEFRKQTVVTAGTLLELWPLLLVCSVVWFFQDILKHQPMSALAVILPPVIFGVAHASFLSQALWGSSYGIWPLFFLLLTITARRVTSRLSLTWATVLVGSTAVFLSLAGFCYLYNNVRLQYANVNKGVVDRFRTGPLAGLSARGPFVGDFKELLNFAKGNIPDADGVVLFPGEDPFYFATGRRPAFPVVTFDNTVNPYSPKDLADLIQARNISWIVVKRKLQSNELPMDNLSTVLQLLQPQYDLDVQLRGYDVFHRRSYAVPR